MRDVLNSTSTSRDADDLRRETSGLETELEERNRFFHLLRANLGSAAFERAFPHLRLQRLDPVVLVDVEPGAESDELHETLTRIAKQSMPGVERVVIMHEAMTIDLDESPSSDRAWDLASDALQAVAQTLDAMVSESEVALVEIKARAERIDRLNAENQQGLERLLVGAPP